MVAAWPVVRWLVVVGLVAGLALPVAARLFPVDGRGAGLALPVGLAVVWWGTYVVGHVAFGPVAAVAGLLALVAVAAACALDRSALRAGRLSLADLPARIDPRAVRQAATVALAGFVLVLWIRSLDPAVHPLGGEKFLDFGLLKSLARTGRLPPEDVWFAGESVAYYYGGHLLASALADLAAVPPRLAYNLALATFYGALLGAAYELAAAVGVARGTDRRLAGAGAVFLVGLASNLAPAGRLLLRSLPAPLADPLVGAVAGATGRTPAAVRADARGFFYFDASRVIPGTINEFPLFAWLNGDLHAHMMGTPFLVLAAALGYAYYRAPAVDRRRRRLLAFGAVPAVAGLVAVVDTWSFPTVFGLLWLAAAFAPAPPWTLLPPGLADAVDRRLGARSVRAELARPVAALGVAGLAGLVGAALAAPFLLGPAAASSRSVALLAPGERSPLGPLLLVHGPVLAVLWASLLARTSDRRALLAAAVALSVVVGLAVGLAVLPVVGPLLCLAWAAGRFTDDVGYGAVLAVAGAGLVGLVEVVYVVERAGPLRMNTVFKTYAQVWVLWGVAGGIGLATYLDDRPGPGRLLDAVGRRRLRIAFAVALVCSTGLYAGLALSSHADAGPQAPGGPTLDATAFVAADHPDAAPAIRRLDRLEGQPTLLSAPATSLSPGPGGSYPAPPGMYDWNSSPAASLTGVPTVAGWAHEIGYRGRTAYLERVRDVDAAYVEPDRRAALLRAYDVRYVWVGPAERARYDRDSFGFGSTAGVEATVVVRTETVTVYRVRATG
jgi:YYY domain-containing protein